MFYRYEELITLYERKHGKRPGYREIAHACNISTATIRKVIENKPVTTQSLEKLARFFETTPGRMIKDTTEQMFYDDEL